MRLTAERESSLRAWPEFGGRRKRTVPAQANRSDVQLTQVECFILVGHRTNRKETLFGEVRNGAFPERTLSVFFGGNLVALFRVDPIDSPRSDANRRLWIPHSVTVAHQVLVLLVEVRILVG